MPAEAVEPRPNRSALLTRQNLPKKAPHQIANRPALMYQDLNQDQDLSQDHRDLARDAGLGTASTVLQQ